jgi:hypothetical protein
VAPDTDAIEYVVDVAPQSAVPWVIVLGAVNAPTERLAEVEVLAVLRTHEIYPPTYPEAKLTWMLDSVPVNPEA